MLSSTIQKPSAGAEPTPPSRQVRPDRPSRIGRYAVLRELGAGGMGVVYAAYDEELDRKVAVKLLRAEGPARPEQRTRVQREAQAMARVSHPNVVSVYEVGESDGQVFIAMEYIDGTTLAAWQEGGHPWDEVLKMYRAAGEGLAAAHQAGLVHRDFKPDNVLVGKDGRPRVADFGLAHGRASPEPAKLVEPAPMESSQELLRSPLTIEGTVLGTPAFMSPEQHRGENADSRSDQFSFCAALYQTLYGIAPFAGSTLSELSRNVLSGQLRPPPRSSQVPVRIGAALQRGLAAEPAERHPSMAELLAAITLDVHSDPAVAPGARRFFATVMVVAIAVTTALIYLLHLDRHVTMPWMIAVEGGLTIGALGLAFLMRRSLRENAFHRGMVKILLILGAQVLCLRIVSYLLGITVRQVLVIEHVLIAGICAVIGVYHLPGGWVLAAGYAVMALALSKFGPQLAPLAPASYLVLTVAVAALWARAARKLPATRASPVSPGNPR